MKFICIDPGHGGKDSGASYGHEKEADINLRIATLLRCFVEMEGYEAYLTRLEDIYISLQNRCDIANTMEADLFISIHCDAFHNKTTKGISTHIYTKASSETEAIASVIHRSLTENFPTHINRGLKKSDFYVLKHTKMPALLIECEFLSNPEMRKFLHEPKNQFAIANAISNGILKL